MSTTRTDKIKQALVQTPRTNAEAKAFQCLDDMAQIAGLYHRLSWFYDSSIVYDYYNCGIPIPEGTSRVLDEWRNLRKDLFHRIGAELIDAISEYNNAVDEVNADNRQRNEILKSEGYNFKTKKFENG